MGRSDGGGGHEIPYHIQLPAVFLDLRRALIWLLGEQYCLHLRRHSSDFRCFLREHEPLRHVVRFSETKPKSKPKPKPKPTLTLTPT